MLNLTRRKGQSILVDGGRRITYKGLADRYDDYQCAELEYTASGGETTSHLVALEESIDLETDLKIEVRCYNWPKYNPSPDRVSVVLGIEAPKDIVAHREEVHQSLVEAIVHGEKTDRRPCTGFGWTPVCEAVETTSV